MKLSGFITLAAPLVASIATAQPVFSPTTGSYYEVVQTHGSWTSARDAAAASSYLGVSGRLATITTQAENDFVLNILGAAGSTYWLGAYQPNPSVPPDQGWNWIAGESWGFTNWRRAGGTADEPNDFGGSENCLEILDASYGQYSGTWNDLADNNVELSEGYVIEYAPVPEPGTFALVGMGFAFLIRRRVRK